ncbi:HTH domain-containing protein [Methanococcus voltae]|uniref:Helix-turn-helix type 11 domain protein n=1 Tax=Methanococcus voltae (strain ATCC BAA-1334 / A3) TaxID=456320 RepID=D7DQY4_METV3|nr:HTH domain-containing protein [Methanococcus voltae]MCS3900921.1 biotin operon repressor [Methanococcus voltae]
MLNKLDIHKKRELEFWTFLEKAFEINLKLDLGHFKILCVFLDINDFYEDMSRKGMSNTEIIEILRNKGILSKNSEYISGEYLKNYIERDSRVAVHNRINDLKKLGFGITTKPGPLGGYKLYEFPSWFFQ